MPRAEVPWSRRPLPRWSVGDRPWLLTDVRIVDVTRGRRRPERALLIRDGRIERFVQTRHLDAVRRRENPAREIDGGGRHVIPGLIDAHAHITLVSPFAVGLRERRHHAAQRERACEAAVERGCTTVRDCGAPLDALTRLRAAIDGGRLIGPRILSAVGALSPPGGYGDYGRVGNAVGGKLLGGAVFRFPDGPRALDEALARLRRERSQLLKIYLESRPLWGGRPGQRYPLFDHAALARIRAAADDAGVPLAAHAMFLDGCRLGLAAGVDALEHLPVDGAYTDADADALAQRGIAVVPTLSLGLLLTMHCGADGYPDDPEVRRLAALRRRLAPGWLRHAVVAGLRPTLERTLAWLDRPQQPRRLPLLGRVHARRIHGFARHAPANLATLRRAGVRLGIGTDGGTGITFAGLLDGEFAALRDHGCSPAEILRMATADNAAILGLDGTIGAIRRGLRADLVLVDGDPLADVAALSRVRMVFKAGRLLVG